MESSLPMACYEGIGTDDDDAVFSMIGGIMIPISSPCCRVVSLLKVMVDGSRMNGRFSSSKNGALVWDSLVCGTGGGGLVGCRLIRVLV